MLVTVQCFKMYGFVVVDTRHINKYYEFMWMCANCECKNCKACLYTVHTSCTHIPYIILNFCIKINLFLEN